MKTISPGHAHMLQPVVPRKRVKFATSCLLPSAGAHPSYPGVKIKPHGDGALQSACLPPCSRFNVDCESTAYSDGSQMRRPWSGNLLALQPGLPPSTSIPAPVPGPSHTNTAGELCAVLLLLRLSEPWKSLCHQRVHMSNPLRHSHACLLTFGNGGRRSQDQMLKPRQVPAHTTLKDVDAGIISRADQSGNDQQTSLLSARDSQASLHGNECSNASGTRFRGRVRLSTFNAHACSFKGAGRENTGP